MASQEIPKPPSYICENSGFNLCRYEKDYESFAIDERAGGRWPTNRDLRECESFFSELMPEGFIQFLEEYHRDKGTKAAVFDCMGFGNLFNDLSKSPHFQGGVSLSLGFDTTSYRAAYDKKERNVVHATGNILTQDAWDNVDIAAKSIGVAKFGLIICAPKGGFDYIFPHSAKVYYSIVSRLYDRLSNHGVLLMEVPLWMDDDGIDSFIESINEKYPLKTKLPAAHMHHFRIRKDPLGLANLPKNNMITQDERLDLLMSEEMINRIRELDSLPE